MTEFTAETEEYKEILELLKEEYSMVNPQIISKNDRGLTSENIVVLDSQEKYFIKIYHRKRDIDKIQDIGDVKKYFSSKGIPVIESLRNKHGNKIGRYKSKFFKVRPFVKAVEIDSLPSNKAVISLGQMLAHIHIAGKGQIHLSHRKIEKWNKDQFLSEAEYLLDLVKSVDPKTEFDDMAQEFLETKISLASKCSVKFSDLGLIEDTLCHGDFHYQNVFFDSNDEVSFVFDFERAFKGSQAAELARAMFFICFDINTTVLDEISEIHFERSRSFLKAYSELYKFTWEDLQKGIQWFYWSMLVCSTWPLEKHYTENIFQADNWLPKRLSRLKYISQNLEKIYEKIKF
jgi:Ser/Thr protein kinase RdoA (MazF antagonist)